MSCSKIIHTEKVEIFTKKLRNKEMYTIKEKTNKKTYLSLKNIFHSHIQT